MAYGYISLALGSFSIVCDTFTSTDPPRFGEFPEPQFNVSRNLIAPGNPYGEGEEFNFTAILPYADYLNLLGLFREHRRLVDARQDAKILCYDTTLEFQELGSTPTRGKAPAPFDTTSTSGGYVYYYAGFYVLFKTRPQGKFWANGSDGSALMEVALSLVESGEKVAP